MAICPQCHTLHGDQHQFCQRCGNPLAAEENAARSSCNNCRATVYPGQNFCTECGQRIRNPIPARKSGRPVKSGLFYPPPQDKSRPAARPRRYSVIISGVALCALVLGGVYFWMQEPARKPVVIAPGDAVQSFVPPRTDTLQREVERVAEKIRAAHLNKDMNQFLSCYSPAYPELGQLERSIYEYWKTYDFKNVAYNLSNVRLIGPNQASAELIWNFQLFNHQSKAFELHRAAFQVILEGGSGNWKIRESKEIGYS